MSSTITITVTVDQQACIRAGIVPTETARVEIDLATLSEAERGELARLTEQHGLDRPVYLTYATDGYNSNYPRCLPTAEGVVTMIRTAMERRAEQAQQKIRYAEEERAKGIAAAQAALALPIDGWIRCYGVYGAMEAYRPNGSGTNNYQRAYHATAGIAERYAAAEAEAARRTEAARREREAEEERKLTEQQAGEARLRAWADAHGSDLLRARMADGYNWIGLAHQEFAALHTPAGYGTELDADGYEDRESPTLGEIEAHRDAKRLVAEHPDLYAEAELLYNTVEPDEDDEDSEATHYVSVRLRIICPDGASIAVERKL